MFTIKWKVLDPVPRVLYFSVGLQVEVSTNSPGEGSLKDYPIPPGVSRRGKLRTPLFPGF